MDEALSLWLEEVEPGWMSLVEGLGLEDNPLGRSRYASWYMNSEGIMAGNTIVHCSTRGIAYINLRTHDITSDRCCKNVREYTWILLGVILVSGQGSLAISRIEPGLLGCSL